MFGRKTKELEESLRQERKAHEQDLQKLHALQSEVDLEKQELKVLRDTYRQKLQELDADKVKHQEEYAELLQKFDVETKQRRNTLDEEILLRKRQTEEQVQKNLTALRDNYNYYLSQLKLLMDILTKVSVTVSGAILSQEDMDTAELFRTTFSTQIDPKTFLQIQPDKKPEASHGETEEYVQNEAINPGREEAL